MPSNSDQISGNSLAPRRAQGGSGSMEQHSIPDQIAADRYAQSKAAMRGSRLGYRRVLLRPGNNADLTINGSCE